MPRLKAEGFFSEAEKDLIRQSVRDVEKNTSGEVAVMVVDGSSRYDQMMIMGSLILGGLASWFLSLALPNLNWHDPRLFLPPCLAGYVLLRFFPTLIRPLILPGELESAVARAAEAAFLARGLDRTGEHTGVLFYISLFERRVRLLADSGIYARIGQETLDRYAATVVDGLRHNKSAEALIKAIAAVGAELTEYFPRKPGDINELPDELITG